MGALLVGNDGRKADQWVVDSWVWDQIGLELGEIDIECTIEAQTRSDGRDYLCYQAVQVLEIRSWDIQIAATNIVDGFVIDKESTIGILDSAVSRQDSVVGLDNSGRDLWCRVDGELEL